MLAVSATETPNRKNALHWLLLTTEGLDSAGAESRPEAEAAGVGNLVETAKTAIRWYVLRWTIELFFKALKTGARIEDRRLDHADDLRKCLVFDAITACHVFDLERMARDKPDTPADEVVSQEEIDVLYALLKAQGGPGRARAAGPSAGYPHLCDRPRRHRWVSPSTTAAPTGNPKSLASLRTPEMVNTHLSSSERNKPDLKSIYISGVLQGPAPQRSSPDAKPVDRPQCA